MTDITYILQQIDSGDLSASEELLPLVYNEFRKRAATQLVMGYDWSILNMDIETLVNERRSILGDTPDPVPRSVINGQDIMQSEVATFIGFSEDDQ